MSPEVGKEQRMCLFCGKLTRHTIVKSVKYHESPTDFTKSTYIFSRTYTCEKCKITTKA
jgi:hypothetical protein